MEREALPLTREKDPQRERETDIQTDRRTETVVCTEEDFSFKLYY